MGGVRYEETLKETAITGLETTYLEGSGMKEHLDGKTLICSFIPDPSNYRVCKASIGWVVCCSFIPDPYSTYSM